MDALHLSIALGPVAIYLFVLGWINMSKRPIVTTGFRDLAALVIAMGGFAVVGPLDLFLPAQATYRFGPFVWLMMLGLYALFATLVLLLMRPRIVIYNITVEQLRPLLSDAARRLDDNSRWMGEGLMMPHRGIQLHIESFPAMRNIQLVSAGPKQDYGAWKQLEFHLRQSVGSLATTANPRGIGLIAFSAAILVLITVLFAGDQQAIPHAVVELLRLN